MGLLSPESLQRCGVTGGDVLIEAGTDGGRSLGYVTHLFNTIHTIEVNEASYLRGKKRLKHRENVTCHQGNSPEVLAKIIDPKRETVFFLDAHYVDGGKPSVGPQCPLMDELKVIFGFTWGYQPVIIVDDSRMFSEWFWKRRAKWTSYLREHWPSLRQITELCVEHGYHVEEIKGMLLIAQE